MRILHLVHSFPPESHGGTEIYVQDLALAQHRRGDVVTVLAGSEKPDRSQPCTREEHVGLPVWRVTPPARGMPSLVGADAGVRASLEQVLAHEKPELVHLHHWHNLTSDAIATARRHGARAVVTLHDLWISCPLFFRLPDARDVCPPSLPLADCVRCIARLTGAPEQELADGFARRIGTIGRELALAGAVLALSEPQRRLLSEVEALRRVPFAIVPLPTPVLPAADRRGARPREQGRLRVASWGGLDRGKGLLAIVEAAERLDAADRIAVHHHGRILDEAYRDEIVRAARRIELHLHGGFAPSDLVAASANYDVAVFASLYLETFGLVVDEALQLGLPVLVSDRGAPKERVGTRGRVFPAHDAAALAALLEACRAGSLLEELSAGRPAPPTSMEVHLVAIDAAYRSALAAPAV